MGAAARSLCASVPAGVDGGSNMDRSEAKFGACDGASSEFELWNVGIRDSAVAGNAVSAPELNFTGTRLASAALTNCMCVAKVEQD
jgi:hypothetical protein